MISKEIEFRFNRKENYYEVYKDVITPDGKLYALIGLIGINILVNKYAFQPNKTITHYSDITLSELANFITKLNKKLEAKDDKR